MIMSKLDKQNQYRLILNWNKENWDELEFRCKLREAEIFYFNKDRYDARYYFNAP